MKVVIDKYSGFCFGVVSAIRRAEEELEKTGRLFCLGDLVNNNAEMQRLKEKGLQIINHETFETLKNCTVLIRAHGEPPSTYRTALENDIRLIDASCPVVLKLQTRIKKGYDQIKKNQGQLAIYGREGHAEVNGLVGQAAGKAIVMNHPQDIKKMNSSGTVYLFSQTTQSTTGFLNLVEELKRKGNRRLVIHNTICKQVSKREPKLREFVKKYDIIIFVSGKKSSNGTMLYSICRNENPNTFFVSDTDDLNPCWFSNSHSVGICGATSTPLWLMERIAQKIKKIS